VDEARHTLSIVIILAALTGIAFPALVIGLAQVLFPHQADGSLLHNADGAVVGSELVGQNFTGPGYFHPRPSAAGADGYDASSSSGANLSPTNPNLAAALSERAAAYREENGIPPSTVLPADAVTTSASGLDPHISPANARLQIARVARGRNRPESEIAALVDRHTDGRLLGFFGERTVNVPKLNLELDREFGAPALTTPAAP
jgi:K+-transporting ATPase ATPase C chain